jgi:ABC-type polysaccharide/polyol phosphate export permease
VVFQEIADVLHYRDLLAELIRRHVTARYKRSVLGVLWTLLDPMLTMLVMAVVFTALFVRTVPAFPVFLLSGLIIWNFFSQSTVQAMNDFLNSSHVVGKVYLPGSVFSTASVGAGLVNLLISLIPLAGLMVLFRLPFTSSLLFLPIAILLGSLFTLGASLILASWVVFFADLQNAYNIVLRLLFYLSGVIFAASMLPPTVGNWLKILPTYQMVALFRQPIYDGVWPTAGEIAYFTAWAIGLLLVGLWSFTRRADEYIYRL